MGAVRKRRGRPTPVTPGARRRVPVALTIAGSDSGGGAGIQADLKTFAAHGVHGVSAITAVTAQNTRGVRAVQAIDPFVVRAQIEAIVDDFRVDAAKTGMLYNTAIVETVARTLRPYGFPLVVDPVMVAKSGARLLEPDAVDALRKRLLPAATVVTPNVPEAEVLAGMRIRTEEDAGKAARRIAREGPKAVVVKGGHLPRGLYVEDVLFYERRLRTFRDVRVETRTTHGTGCTFSSALAANLALGDDLVMAVASAKHFVTLAIEHGLPIGGGHGPVNPLASLSRAAERYLALEDVRQGVALLESVPGVASLIPESQSNLVKALAGATSEAEVVGIPGRIVRIGSRVRASSPPAFGGSGHVARTVLTAMTFDPGVRAGMNLRLGPDMLAAARKAGWTLASYDRRKEPREIKRREGRTAAWGAVHAIRSRRRVPDAIYHRGDLGKEPMVTLLGRDALDVAERAALLARTLEELRRRRAAG